MELQGAVIDFESLNHARKSLVLHTPADARALVERVATTAEATQERLHLLLERGTPLQILYNLKFHAIGLAPFGDDDLNLVEQLNQTFTYLTSFHSVLHLFEKHPEHAPYRVNLGTQPGFDIESTDGGSVAAEVFAATHPNSNDKLNKDARRLSERAGAYRYRFVFYHSPNARHEGPRPHHRYPNVLVVPVAVPLLG